MASWKKVIVSGSNAELCSLTINEGTGLGLCTQIISSSATDTELFGTFDGTHIGDGKQLTDVTGSKVVTTNNTAATAARITFTAAGTGTQALCSNGSLTYDATNNAIGASITGNAATATTATTATCVTLTNAPDSSNDSYIPFSNGASGGQDLCTDSAFYYTPNTDTLTVTNINGTVSNATCATCIGLTETDTGTYCLVFASSASYAEARIDNTLTYDAANDKLTVNGAICAVGQISAGNGTAAGTFTSNGDSNVILKTGNSTSGNITITDGANGDISITPNGTGKINIGGNSPTITNSQGASQALCIEGGVSGVCVKDAGGLAVECSLSVGGDLIVQGDLAYLNVTNLAVEDKFILLNSGSTDPDEAGIVVDEGSGTGHAFVFDSDTSRWGFTGSLPATTGSMDPDAFAAAVVTSDIPEYRKNGNIRVESGDIYIYVE